MGFIRGALVRVIKHAPLRDPVEYCIGGTHVTLRLQEARQIIVEQVTPPPFCRREDGGGRGRAKTVRRTQPKIGRNDPCPCGSGKKYKKCCMLRDQAQSGS